MRLARRLVTLTAALASAALTVACEDWFPSRESREEIAAIQSAVESNPEAVNLPTPTGELPLAVAMRTGSSSLTEWLLARGASPVARDAKGGTPLHVAVIYDRPAFTVLQELLARGQVDANVADDRRVTPLHLAAEFLQPAAIEILLRAGADPNRPDERGRTPLHELGGLLQPPDPELRAPDPKSAAAQPAATEAAMDRLLKAGGRLDTGDRQGLRPLHVYALSGNLAAVRAALSHGADVFAEDSRGQTPLFPAAAFARIDVVSALLAKGADVRHRDARGLTALWAMRYTVPKPADAPRVAAMLKAAGATDSEELPLAARTAAPPGGGEARGAASPATIENDLRGERLAAQAGEMLVADTYIDEPELRAFLERFKTAPAATLCAAAAELEPLAPEVTVTRCGSPRCPGGECAGAACEGAGPPEMESREIAIGATCKAIAFFRDIPGLGRGGSVEHAAAQAPEGGDWGAERWRFRFRNHAYALKVTDRWASKSGPTSEPRRTRLELARDGEPMAVLLETGTGDELSCASPPWLGDLNGDGAVDVIFQCHRNIYEQWSGLSLSVAGSSDRRLVLQRSTGGIL